MNIGIDIDDTINELHNILIEKATEFNKKEHRKFEIKKDKWHWEEAFGWDEITAQKFARENMKDAYLNAGIKPNAARVINNLHNSGNKIVIITSRSKNYCDDIYKVSEEWLKKQNIQFDKLVVDTMNKALACAENDIDVFIDDHVDFCENVSKTNTKVLMFNSPYNQEETKYKRVFSWDDVEKEINNISKAN